MMKEHYGNSPTPALATLEVHSHQCALMRRAQTRRRSHPRARPHRSCGRRPMSARWVLQGRPPRVCEEHDLARLATAVKLKRLSLQTLPGARVRTLFTALLLRRKYLLWRCALACERLRCEPWRPWGWGGTPRGLRRQARAQGGGALRPVMNLAGSGCG